MGSAWYYRKASFHLLMSRSFQPPNSDPSERVQGMTIRMEFIGADPNPFHPASFTPVYCGSLASSTSERAGSQCCAYPPTMSQSSYKKCNGVMRVSKQQSALGS